MARSRYPALQVPAASTGDTRSFFEAVKERLEITTGDRGDPRDRLLTVRDVEAAGMATVTVRNKFATLSGGASAAMVSSLLDSSGQTGDFDGLSAPTLDQLAATDVVDALDFVTYNNTADRVQRVPYQVLRELFLTAEGDAEVGGNWQFQNEELAIEIAAEVPRLRFSEVSDTETLPADGSLWDWIADDQLMQLLLVSDDEDTSVSMLELARDGLDPSFLALLNGTILQIQDGTLADPGLTFDDDIDTGFYRIADNRIGVGAGGVLALDITGTQTLIPAGTVGAPAVAFQADTNTGMYRVGADILGLAAGGALPLALSATQAGVLAGAAATPSLTFQVDTDTGLFRAAADALGVATAGAERLRVTNSGLTVTGTAVLTAATGHLDVIPSAAADFAALKVRNNAGTEIWRLNSETDGDLDFARQSGTGLLRLNSVALIDAALFTTGTLADARLSSNVPLKNAANVFTALNTFNSNLLLESANPRFLVQETGLAADTGMWDWNFDGGAAEFRTRTDADGAGVNVLKVLRPSGSTTPTRVFFGNEATADFAGLSTVAGNFANYSWVFTNANNSTRACRLLIPFTTVTGAGFNTVRYVGSFSAPTQIVNNSLLGFYVLGGYNTDLATIREASGFVARSLQDWSATSASAALDLLSTANGTTTVSTSLRLHGAQVQHLDGSASAPAVTFQNDLGLGMYRAASNTLGLSAAGTEVFNLAADTLTVNGASENARFTVGSLTGTGLTGINGITLAATGSCQYRILARGAAAATNAFRVNGTSASPTAVVLNNNIAQFFAFGASNTTPTLSPGAGFTMTATENWSGSAFGCRLNLFSTATGTTTLVNTCLLLGNQAQFQDGTVALPAVSLQNDTDCGLYRIAANQLGISCNATNVLDLSTALVAITATTVRLNTTSATTVGAAGGASALPATPLGYITANVNGTAVKIPYYNT